MVRAAPRDSHDLRCGRRPAHRRLRRRLHPSRRRPPAGQALRPCEDRSPSNLPTGHCGQGRPFDLPPASLGGAGWGMGGRGGGWGRRLGSHSRPPCRHRLDSGAGPGPPAKRSLTRRRRSWAHPPRGGTALLYPALARVGFAPPPRPACAGGGSARRLRRRLRPYARAPKRHCALPHPAVRTSMRSSLSTPTGGSLAEPPRRKTRNFENGHEFHRGPPRAPGACGRSNEPTAACSRPGSAGSVRGPCCPAASLTSPASQETGAHGRLYHKKCAGGRSPPRAAHPRPSPESRIRRPIRISAPPPSRRLQGQGTVQHAT